MQDLLFSGVKPTGTLHLGNYIGALKQWTEIQHRYQCYFCIVDLHAITVPQDPAQLRKDVLDIAAVYLASGLDPKRCNIFIQSEVPEHTELGWILGCIAKMGEMERMTQFKDKSSKEGRERAGLGLFSYPALMAADILLYDTTVVPVGEDQTQHVELTRLLAKRFNDKFGPTFTLPQLLIQKHGARIMSLTHPEKKMSKSDESKNGAIMLDDEPDVIRKKIMKAVTDTEPGVVYDAEKRPAVANLMAIYHHATGKTLKEIEKEFAGKGYGDFKKSLAEAVVEHLRPIREKLEEYRQNPKELMDILDHGRDMARHAAREKMKLVKDRLGLGRG
jgi:tryptophanyl-tRNA synthetase